MGAGGLRVIMAMAVLAALTSCIQPSTVEPVATTGQQEAAPGKLWEPSVTTPPWNGFKRHTLFDNRRAAISHTVSPDGKVIVYSSREYSETPQIYLRSTEKDAAPVRLTFNGGGNLSPAISPDGRLVAFASDKEGDWNIFVLRIDHPAAVAQVTFSTWDEETPSWSPDGRKIAYNFTSNDGGRGIAVINLDTQATTIIGPGRSPSWRPKGAGEELIVFERDHTGGGTDILTVKPDGTDVREFETWREGDASSPVWSPDGMWIAFVTLSADRRSAIHLIRTDGSDRLDLLDDRNVKERPAWGGDRLYFIVDEEGGRNICSIKPFPLSLLEEPGAGSR